MTRKNVDPCTIPDCPGLYFSRGWCAKHYSRWQRHGDPLIQGRLVLKPQTFEELIDRSGGPDACWPWRGPVSTQGYGRWNRDYGYELAHREAWRRAFGEPPPKKSGLVLDHNCHDPKTCPGGAGDPHRRCCNPAHLVVATFFRNSSADRNSRPWHQPAHCPQGHPYDEANTYWTPDGHRQCRACNQARDRLRWHTQRHQGRR